MMMTAGDGGVLSVASSVILMPFVVDEEIVNMLVVEADLAFAGDSLQMPIGPPLCNLQRALG